MGSQFPPLDQFQVEKILKKAGFVKKRQKGTSHAHWEVYIDGKRRIVTVDFLGGKKSKYGHTLLKSMIRQSGMKKKKFYSYL